jgi:predicted small lipoprotein YifL
VSVISLSSVAARARAAAAIVCLAGSLAACGRYGPLEPPPNPNAPKPAADSSNPAGQQLTKPPIPPITPPKQPFFLDFLLK